MDYNINQDEFWRASETTKINMLEEGRIKYNEKMFKKKYIIHAARELYQVA